MKGRIDLKLNKISRLEILGLREILDAQLLRELHVIEKLKESIYELDQKLEGKQRDYQI